jgi:hypothetical protein
MAESYRLFPSLSNYLVEPTDNENVPYRVTGPRSSWRLMRNQNNRSILFAVNDRINGVAQIRGFEWFTDKTGRVEPLRR